MINIKYNKVSGIYKIINKINNKIYIGSSINLYKRVRVHFSDLNRNKHANKHLQRSFIKHGINNFFVEILEEVNNKKLLIEREQYYLDTLKPFDHVIGYNINPVAGSSLGHKFSAESKNKMSLSAIGKRVGNKNGMYGKKRPDNIIRNKQGIGIKLKKETIEKLRINNRNKSILQFDMNGKLINKFISLGEAMRCTNVDVSCISQCCTGKRNSAGGYAWKFFIQNEDINNFGEDIKIKIKQDKKPIEQYDMEMNLINKFISINKAVKSTGYCWKLIKKICNNELKSYDGFIWIYS